MGKATVPAFYERQDGAFISLEKAVSLAPEDATKVLTAEARRALLRAVATITAGRMPATSEATH